MTLFPQLVQHLGPNGIVDGTNGRLTVVMLVFFFILMRYLYTSATPIA